MHTGPTTKNAPPQGTCESLEAAVYRASLAEGNASIRRANPIVTVPITLAMYLVCGGAVWYLARTSKTVQAALKKTVGIDLSEPKELVNEAPSPPPAPAAVAPPRPVEKNEVPPPPLPTNQETVPEQAPKELPKEDLSLKFAQPSSGTTKGGPTTGTPGGVQGPGGHGTSSGSSGKVVDFDFSQIRIKYQPPAPPYPPIARIARIQGTVVVQITIDPRGMPIKATAIEGPPQLRPTAESYAMQWRFEPALLNGVPQFGRFTLTMPFRLR